MDYKRTFTETILPLKNNLMRYSYSFLKDRHKAEDMVQETMIRMWNIKEKWREMDNLQGYCLGIIRHLCLDELRKRKNHYYALNVAHQEQSTDNDPLEHYSSKEVVVAISNAMLTASCLGLLIDRTRRSVPLCRQRPQFWPWRFC